MTTENTRWNFLFSELQLMQETLKKKKKKMLENELFPTTKVLKY